MALIGFITTVNWAISLLKPGAIVTGDAAINQRLFILFNTQKGSVPLLPLYGINLLNWIDKPINRVAAGLSAEMIEQVALYEPDVKILSITHTIAGGQIKFTVNWQFGAITSAINVTYGISAPTT